MNPAAIDFFGVRLRSNPHLRLIPYDRLPSGDRDTFKGLSQDPDFYGILAPPEGSVLPAKSVSRDAALLFLALREPACLPHLLNGVFGIQVSERLRPLVLDAVFEVEHAGRFVSGPAALELMRADQPKSAPSRLAQVSSDAIAYAFELEALSPYDIAHRLYMFNASPSTPDLQRRFGSDDTLLGHLVATDEGARILRSYWRRESIGSAWLAWRAPGSASPANYKLYVSPTLEHLPRVFEIAVETFAGVRCAYFKLGRGAHGVSRSDKLVGYFSSLESLRRAAERIQSSATGAAAQGVPFTASIDADGLLSWGMDPPRFTQVLAGQEWQSWRQWLTGRVAAYLLAAKAAGADALSFVHHRVALDGVDPQTWNPNLAIWREAADAAPEVN